LTDMKLRLFKQSPVAAQNGQLSSRSTHSSPVWASILIFFFFGGIVVAFVVDDDVVFAVAAAVIGLLVLAEAPFIVVETGLVSISPVLEMVAVAVVAAVVSLFFGPSLFSSLTPSKTFRASLAFLLSFCLSSISFLL